MKVLISTLFLVPMISSCASPSKSDLDAEVKRLCAIDGGIKVYEKVKLPANKFDQYGRILIPSKKDIRSNDEYFYEWDRKIIKPGDPENGEPTVWRDNFKFYRIKDNNLLGEEISYVRRGGDISGPWHPSSFRCPINTAENSIEKQIFVKSMEGVQ